MSKSILQDEKKCWVTGREYGLQEHHVFGGANRKHSEHYGLKVWLYWEYHTGDYGVHNGNRRLDIALKKLAQTEFEKRYGHDKFMEVFGKNYLD